jgi:hypothetical protein
MILEAKYAAGLLGTGMAGLLASAAPILPDVSWMRPLMEFGSFGVITFASIYVLIRVAPAFITHLDKARDAFLAELRIEREIREKHFLSVNEDLHSIDRSIQSLERTVKDTQR